MPSCSDPERVYLVGLRPESCPCEDHRRSGKTCKYLFAAWTIRAKYGACSGCGRRFPRRDLHEITEDHGSQTFIVGDAVCEPCARDHGVL